MLILNCPSWTESIISLLTRLSIKITARIFVFLKVYLMHLTGSSMIYIYTLRKAKRPTGEYIYIYIDSHCTLYYSAEILLWSRFYVILPCTSTRIEIQFHCCTQGLCATLWMCVKQLLHRQFTHTHIYTNTGERNRDSCICSQVWTLYIPIRLIAWQFKVRPKGICSCDQFWIVKKTCSVEILINYLWSF